MWLSEAYDEAEMEYNNEDNYTPGEWEYFYDDESE